MRKIIQISAIPASTSETESDDGGSCNDETLYALCDDGSVFYFIPGQLAVWEKMPPIPQDENLDEQKPASSQRDVSP